MSVDPARKAAFRGANQGVAIRITPHKSGHRTGSGVIVVGDRVGNLR